MLKVNLVLHYFKNVISILIKKKPEYLKKTTYKSGIKSKIKLTP